MKMIRDDVDFWVEENYDAIVKSLEFLRITLSSTSKGKDFDLSKRDYSEMRLCTRY